MRASALDLQFLRGPFSRRTALRPVNVFELSGFPRWETVASNVLAYFLDPNERHGLGPTFVDALLGLLDGARFIGTGGTEGALLESSEFMGSTDWRVATEQLTSDGKRIDILLSNKELGLCIVIENKMDAALYNPFESYAKHALDEFSRVVSIVLAPTRRLAAAEGEGLWTSASLTYDALFDAVRPQIERDREGADPRSVDLLNQFIENTSEVAVKSDLDAENRELEEFWGALRGNEDAFLEFFAALDRVNQILRARAGRLQTEIAERLELRGIQLDYTTVLVGIDQKWGRRDGLVAKVFVIFHLHGGPGVELMLGFTPGRRQYDLTVKAYGSHARPNKCLPEFDHIPLAANLGQPDAEVAEAFMSLVEPLVARAGAKTAG